MIKRLAEKTDINTLDSIQDKKDKLQSRLFMQKVDKLINDNENESRFMLQRCTYCNHLFSLSQ